MNRYYNLVMPALQLKDAFRFGFYYAYEKWYHITDQYFYQYCKYIIKDGRQADKFINYDNWNMMFIVDFLTTKPKNSKKVNDNILKIVQSTSDYDEMLQKIKVCLNIEKQLTPDKDKKAEIK